MVHYKLIYFDGRGRGEIIRLVLSAAGQDFEDHRFKQTDWPTIKKTAVFGRVPVLEVDGKQLWDSQVIARHLAKKYGLAGKTDEDSLRVDMLSMVLADIQIEMWKWIFGDDKSKDELKKKLYGETLPAFLEAYDKQLKSNNGGKGFLVGDGLTYADLMSYAVTYDLQSHEAGCLDKFPAIKAHSERIANISNVKKWISKRPNSPL